MREKAGEARESARPAGAEGGGRRRLRAAAAAAAALILVASAGLSYVPCRVEGDSMSPTLDGGSSGRKGDVVLLNRIAYLVGEPRRWDVVVIRRREGSFEDGVRDSVKRIVGLPGEEIEIADGRCFAGGRPLEPPPALAGRPVVGKGPYGRGRVRLGGDEYFVLGDSSYVSRDSRSFGPVRRGEIRGRVDWIVFPLSRAGRVR
ncbi:MAG: signal peptidase I [Planctomycetota bacterium]